MSNGGFGGIHQKLLTALKDANTDIHDITNEDPACGDSMLLVEFEAVIDPAGQRAGDRAGRPHSRSPRVRGPGRRARVLHHRHPLQSAAYRSGGARAGDRRRSAQPRRDRAAARSRRRSKSACGTAGSGGRTSTRWPPHAGCSPDEVIARHSGRTYRVYMLGFVPGFAYMGRVDPSIAIAAPSRAARARAGRARSASPENRPGSIRSRARADGS